MKLSREEFVPLCVLPILVALVAACFWPVGNFDFINFDDPLYVYKNPVVSRGLTMDGLAYAFSDRSSGHWHPLTWLSHMLDVQLFGLVPGPQHLANALIHAVNVGLLFLLISISSGNPFMAAIAAALFGLHPMRIESVAWISERKDVLSMFFGLSAMCLYVIAVRGARFRIVLWSGVGLLFCASLLAKPTFVTLPILLLLLDLWPLRRFSWAAVLEKIPFLLISLIFGFAVLAAQQAGDGLRSISEISLSDRIATAAVGCLAYLGKFFWPTGFGVFYPFVRYAPGVAAGATCGILAITVLALRDAASRPYCLFAWGWFLVSLLPLLGFVSIGGQTFADRWTYLPHVGVAWGGVWLAADILNAGRSPKVALSVSVCVLLICASMLRANLGYWRDSVALFTHTLEVAPDNFMAHTNIGTALDAQGDLDGAGQHFEEAARLNPTYPEALNNLGSFRARRGRVAEARELFERALKIRPNFDQARFHLGLVLSDLGLPSAAATEWLRLLNYDPGNVQAIQALRFLMSRNQIRPCDVPEVGAAIAEMRGLLNAWQAPSAETALKQQVSAQLNCS
ncbi:MAG: tetratricopeptide repeat protein [Oligoflexia bacterium]|nr:tetratricopeptide repeat protein [Oligoflexia bacterium]